jgi:biopolymer transport protein ExbB/TolQ
MSTIEIDPMDRDEHVFERVGEAKQLKYIGISLETFPFVFAIVLSGMTCGLAYLNMIPFLKTLIFERGWTQFLTIFLFYWGIGHALKKKQYQWIEREALLRLSVQVQGLIRESKKNNIAQKVDEVSSEIRHEKQRIGHLFFLNLLSHFKDGKPSREEIFKFCNHERDIAFEKLEMHDGVLHAVMWLLPLAGFLGTVLGMGVAIGSFDQLLDQEGADLGSLKPAVKGLSTAFDTTLLSLVLVMPLKSIELSLSKRDALLVETIDQTVGMGFLTQIDLGKLAQHTQIASEQEVVMNRFVRQLESVDQHFKKLSQELVHFSTDIKQQAEAHLNFVQQMSQSLQKAQHESMPQMGFAKMERAIIELKHLHEQILPSLQQEAQQQSQMINQLQYQVHLLQESQQQPFIISKVPIENQMPSQNQNLDNPMIANQPRRS